MTRVELRISAADMEPSIDGRSVTITGAELANGLVHDRPAVLAELGEIATVPIGAVRVDAIGRVVVEDSEFSRRLTEMGQDEIGLGNPNIVCVSFNVCPKAVDEQMLEA